MACPTPPKPWKAEYAKSGRSSCKTCKSAIAKDQLRLGKMVVATQFDGFMPMLNHAGCILKKANQIKSSDEVEGLDLLRWEDQQKIRKYVEGEISSAATASNVESTIEVSQTSRAMCKHCGEKIMKGTILNGLELYFDDVLRDLAFMLSDPMMTVIKACFSKHSQWPPESFRLAGLESCCWFIIPSLDV